MSSLKKDYGFDLPESLIAQKPLENREDCRLLLLNKSHGGLSHQHFYDILKHLPKKGLLILNDTRVIPARIPLLRKTGGKAEVLIERKCEDGSYLALARPSGRLKEGELLSSARHSEFKIQMLKKEEGGMWRVTMKPDHFWPLHMEQVGEIPLPPYIKREEGPNQVDENQYQSVFAQVHGSAAAPTASLHFSEKLLLSIEEMGLEIATLTHHIGSDTFMPLRVDNLEEHRMHSEYYQVPKKTAQMIQSAKKENRPVIAVGTTAVRALESAGENILNGMEAKGDTRLFIRPPYDYKIVDELITNFHLPESSLMMLVSALVGRERLLSAYAEAIKERYRFFSYGDAMYIHR